MSAGRIAACLVVLTLVAGCGDDADRDARPTAERPPATTSTPGPSPTPQATATATPEPTATPAAPPAERDEGDEAGNRVRVELTLEAGAVTPSRIEVPAFLGLTLAVRNASAAERILRLDGRPVLELLPGASGTADVEGLRPGEHVVDTGPGGSAVLVAERAE